MGSSSPTACPNIGCLASRGDRISAKTPPVGAYYRTYRCVDLSSARGSARRRCTRRSRRRGVSADRRKDNFAVDREPGEQYRAIFPEIMDIARADRAFLGRAVRYIPGEAGVRQFLDISAPGCRRWTNTHEAAQRVAPDSRIVYVDN